jgi:hypothetical protein
LTLEGELSNLKTGTLETGITEGFPNKTFHNLWVSKSKNQLFIFEEKFEIYFSERPQQPHTHVT